MANFQFNWFDVVVLGVLVAGAFRGRRRGMSQELIPLIKWLTLVLVCGFCYRPVAGIMAEYAKVFSMLTASITAYLTLALVIAIIFAVISRQLGGKIIGSDAFGKSEYYLGIVSGMVRFACLLVFGLSLLNARYYTQDEINARNRYVQKNYDNDFVPALFQVQDQVFKESFAGPVIRQQLSSVLIAPVKAENKKLQRNHLDDLPI
jgi:uncharacterized membrane protein required for colicin V production